MARIMTLTEYQSFIQEALTIATKGLELPEGVRVTIEPRVQVYLPDSFAANDGDTKLYQKFVDDLNIVLNAMQLQIHMLAGSTAAAPDPPEYRDNFPLAWFQEYRKWYDMVVRPTRKSIEDIEAAQNDQQEEELKKVREAVNQSTETLGRSTSSISETHESSE